MLNPLLILYLKTQVLMLNPSLNSVFENPSIDANRKVAMFAFYALKHREEIAGFVTLYLFATVK